jgi:DNA-binding MarR family transcriptional regulator
MSRTPAVGQDAPAPDTETLRRRANVSEADRVAAQRLLATLGRLGSAIDQALRSRVDPEIVENHDVLVIATLDIQGPLRPSQVREITGMSSSGVTKLLDRLERLDLITREFGAVPGDRRGATVSLTPTGRDVAGRLAEGLRSQMDVVRWALRELGSITDGGDRTALDTR